jgi:hypothetical protein
MPAVPHPGAAALSEEFTGWTVWVSGTGRLWASRRDTLTAAGCVAFLHADSPGSLAGQVRAQEALQHRAGWLIAFRGGWC